MDSYDGFFAFIIIGGLILALFGFALNAEARIAKQWKQAVSYGYAEQVIENDKIVFKWIIPATATAELN